jgi:hypothetical protein
MQLVALRLSLSTRTPNSKSIVATASKDSKDISRFFFINFIISLNSGDDGRFNPVPGESYYTGAL